MTTFVAKGLGGPESIPTRLFSSSGIVSMKPWHNEWRFGKIKSREQQTLTIIVCIAFYAFVGIELVPRPVPFMIE
jgi:hypothetical protein